LAFLETERNYLILGKVLFDHASLTERGRRLFDYCLIDELDGIRLRFEFIFKPAIAAPFAVFPMSL